MRRIKCFFGFHTPGSTSTRSSQGVHKSFCVHCHREFVTEREKFYY